MSRQLTAAQRAETWAAIVAVAPIEAPAEPPTETVTLDADTLDEIAKLWRSARLIDRVAS